MTFTTEQYNILAKYDGELERVQTTRTFRNLSDKAVAEIAGVWHAATNTRLRTYTCGQCKFNLLRRVAEAYCKDKEQRLADARTIAEKPREKPKTRKVSTKKTKA